MADEQGHENDDIIVEEILNRRYVPVSLKSVAWESFIFAGHEIKIVESTDLYGATVWPSALVLCYFLEKHGNQLCIEDKNIIEIGSGTGLVAIVASLLGARVTATDLEELIGNLQYNVLKNTKMKSKHVPQVKQLIWGSDLEKKFPKNSLDFDYIFAADVVYNHPYLEELLETFDHLCSVNTTILWVMKFRKENMDLENAFIQKFQKLFDMNVTYNLPSLGIKLYTARRYNNKK
ncbi:protein-lysine methyltransferase METTL21E-like isoform 1-T2 [Leptodactylus fuscus]|uniref:protein-lysine methyltransferase METTL21E-like n=1 Tax=Leptodactylus fuscus TaxID=238119 RepID=UPI003F4E666A